MGLFTNKTLLITGGTGSFGNAVLNRFLRTDIGEIRVFSRDEKKQDDMRHEFQAKMPEVAEKIKFYIGDVRLHVMVACPGFTASNVRFSALVADGSQQGSTPREEGKMMTAEEVARIVAKGIAKRKRLCLMEAEGRATHFVKKFAPGFLDKMFYWVMSKEPDSPFK